MFVRVCGTISCWVFFISSVLPVTGWSEDRASIRGNIDPGAFPPPSRAMIRYQAGAGPEAGPPPAPQAVIYLEGDFTDPAESGSEKEMVFELGQQNLQFESAVLPVQVGTLVSFPNHDDVFHNVFSYAEAKSFDLGRYRRGEEPGKVRFDQAGEVPIFCEVHRHMRSTILVLKTPYFAVSDEDGSFLLENLPVGEYQLSVWYAPGRVISREVVLTAGETLTVDFRAHE